MAAEGNGGVEKAVMPRPCLLRPCQRRHNGQMIRRVRFDESANTTHRFADVVDPQGKLGVQGADSDHLQDRAGHDLVRRTDSDREAMDGGASGRLCSLLRETYACPYQGYWFELLVAAGPICVAGAVSQQVLPGGVSHILCPECSGGQGRRTVADAGGTWACRVWSRVGYTFRWDQ
jgi:hypothetical protein